jgi:hypothetical protein
MEARVLVPGDPFLVGNEIVFHLEGVTNEYIGSVVDVSDTTVEVRLSSPNRKTASFFRKYVRSVRVTETAKSLEGRRKIRVAFSPSQIESIQLHQKGDGAVGFLAGCLIGSVVGYAIENPKFFSDEEEASYAKEIGMAAGSALGVAIATNGRTRNINGSPEKYQALVKKIFPNRK